MTIKFLIFFCFLSINCFGQTLQEDPPLITIENGQKIKFEQFLFATLNTDSVKNIVDTVCCSIFIFAKFNVTKGKISSIYYSPETPIILQQIITGLITKTSTFWSKIHNTNYILPLVFNISNPKCTKSLYDDDDDISHRAFMSIQGNEEHYGPRNLLMKNERFKGVILHPVKMTKIAID